ncbi:MAG: alpha/beta fold hydrolase [Chitinophagaceae bacterium]|nr:alpha/beta fold hydrolase [Chitinophagaceae bacterium]
MNKKKTFRWIKIIVLLYCSIGIALYYLQEKFLFHPVTLAADYTFDFKTPFEEVAIPLNSDETINMVKFFSTDTITNGVVLYYHGNKQNINRYAKFVNAFTKNGYEVWMPDYQGFGKSTGLRTEKKLNELALQVYKMANAKFKNDNIIIYGKSLGTGIAAYAASVTNNKRLILETPYYSIPSLFSCYAPIYPTTKMSTYKIPVNEYLGEVKYPITIFHGTDDGVIPYRNASKLRNVLKPIDEFITIENGTHHNLAEFDLYKKKLDSLLKLR